MCARYVVYSLKKDRDQVCVCVNLSETVVYVTMCLSEQVEYVRAGQCVSVPAEVCVYMTSNYM